MVWICPKFLIGNGAIQNKNTGFPRDKELLRIVFTLDPVDVFKGPSLLSFTGSFIRLHNLENLL